MKNFTLTKNLWNWLVENNLSQEDMLTVCYQRYTEVPDISTDGGEDKNFFVFYFSKKLYACRNEISGYTILEPEDY